MHTNQTESRHQHACREQVLRVEPAAKCLQQRSGGVTAKQGLSWAGHCKEYRRHVAVLESRGPCMVSSETRVSNEAGFANMLAVTLNQTILQ